MIYYSAFACGFFDDAIHAAIPVDAVTIDRATHAALLQRQAEGELIVPDAGGAPVTVPRPGLGPDELFTALRESRTQLLTASDWTQMPDAPLTEADREAWRLYRQTLRDLPATTSDPAAPEWPLPPA